MASEGTAGAEFVVRPYRSRDEEEVVRLWSDCFPGDPEWNAPRRVIADKLRVQPELFLVGLLEGRVACTVLGGFDGFRGWAYHLATAPEHRRRGLARRIMAELERRLASAGCAKLNLQVRLANAAAAAFYRSLGYGREERLSFGKRLDVTGGARTPGA